MVPLPTPVPRVSTERLVLRELRAADFDVYAAFMADPIATAFLSHTPDRRLAWRMFNSLSGQWLVMGAGWWGMELRVTGELVGTVGAFFRESEIGRGVDADLEIGWTVFTAHQRRGYATEAARAALAFGMERYAVKRAIALVEPSNAPSRKVAEAIGMTEEGQTDLFDKTVLRYVRWRAP